MDYLTSEPVDVQIPKNKIDWKSIGPELMSNKEFTFQL